MQTFCFPILTALLGVLLSALAVFALHLLMRRYPPPGRGFWLGYWPIASIFAYGFILTMTSLLRGLHQGWG
jgi:hypothetical protein